MTLLIGERSELCRKVATWIKHGLGVLAVPRGGLEPPRQNLLTKALKALASTNSATSASPIHNFTPFRPKLTKTFFNSKLYKVIKEVKSMQEIKKSIPYISFWILNSSIFYLGSIVFPKNIELGTFRVPENLAPFWAGALLTFIVWFSKPIVVQLGFKPQGEIQAFLYYAVANSVTLWILARFAEFSGFGISRFYWAIGLGLVINLLQMGFWQFFKKYNLV